MYLLRRQASSAFKDSVEFSIRQVIPFYIFLNNGVGRVLHSCHHDYCRHGNLHRQESSSMALASQQRVVPMSSILESINRVKLFGLNEVAFTFTKKLKFHEFDVSEISSHFTRSADVL